MRQAADGFVLVATLWVLAGLAMVAAYFTEQTELSVEKAVITKSQLDVMLDQQSSQQTMLYLLLSQRRNIAGVTTGSKEVLEDDSGAASILPQGNEIRLDGRAYAGIGNSRFSVLDEAGLLSLNTATSSYFDKLLESQGVELQLRQILVARITDYISRTDLASLNGTTNSDYEKEGWLLPTKRYMQSPMELARVLNWDEILTQKQFDDIVKELSSSPTLHLNFNAMSRAYLETLPDLDPQAVDSILAYRKDGAFGSVFDINQVSGRLVTSLDPESLDFVGSFYLRVKVWQKGTTQTQLFGVKLTPFSKVAPWRIIYNYQVSEGHYGAETVANTASPLFKNHITYRINLK